VKRSEIVERLKDILLETDARNEKIIENCTEASRLVSDLGFSSVAILYMVIAIEETFGVVFENVGVGDFKTVGDVVDYLEKRLP